LSPALTFAVQGYFTGCGIPEVMQKKLEVVFRLRALAGLLQKFVRNDRAVRLR